MGSVEAELKGCKGCCQIGKFSEGELPDWQDVTKEIAGLATFERQSCQIGKLRHMKLPDGQVMRENVARLARFNNPYCQNGKL